MKKPLLGHLPAIKQFLCAVINNLETMFGYNRNRDINRTLEHMPDNSTCRQFKYVFKSLLRFWKAQLIATNPYRAFN